MNKIKHAAAKKVFAGVMDYAVDQVNKNPETAYEKIISVFKAICTTGTSDIMCPCRAGLL